MKKVLYLHAWYREQWNCGDDVYLQGSKELITSAIGEHEIIPGVLEHFLRDINNIKEIEGLDLDLIVTTGAPWLYSNFHKAWQYEFLKRLNQLYPNVPKVALGLGGCSGITKNYFCRKKALDACKETFGKFDLIFARDPMTAQFIQLSGVSCELLLDSAVFFPMHKFIDKYKLSIKSDKPVFVYFDFADGICKGDIDKEEEKRIEDMYKYIYKTYDPIVYCVNEPELNKAKELGIEAVWYHKYEELLPVLAQSSFVISGRVHQATLAALLGKKTYVIPFDIRYLCTTAIGVKPLFTQPEPKLNDIPENKPFTRSLIDNTKNIIVNKIREIVK